MPGHADEFAQRKFYVDVAQIVFARSLHREEIAVAMGRRICGTSMRLRPDR